MKIIDIREYVRGLLRAYVSTLGLVIDEKRELDVEQSLAASVIAMTIVLLEFGFFWQLLDFRIDVKYVAGVSVLVVLCWLVGTYIFSNSSMVPLHLNLVSFWMAVTVLFIALAWTIFPEDYHSTMRLMSIAGLLFCTIPTHVFRCNLSLRRKLLYAPLLWVSCTSIGFFASNTYFGS